MRVTAGYLSRDHFGHLSLSESELYCHLSTADSDGIPDLYEITHAMDPKDNGTVRFEFNYSIIENMADLWNDEKTEAAQGDFSGLPVLLNTSIFNPASAFISTGIQGNATRGPNGDLDNDGLTNYEEYSYNMPDDYNLTKDGPYTGGLDPINPDSDNDGLPDGYETQYDLDPYHNDAAKDTDKDGMSNIEEYTYKMDHFLYDAVTKSILASNSTTYLISVQYLPNGIYWNGTIPNNPDTDQDGLKDRYEVTHTYSSSHVKDSE